MTPFWIAFTRDVSPTLAQCELTHLARMPIDIDVARAQHAAYEAALARLDVDVRRVAPAPDSPDAVFIEDTAVVFDELAVITRPGAEARRREVAAVAAALGPLRLLVHLAAPATLDGGDVLVVGRTVYVGRTLRTNDEGASQLRAAVGPHGYDVRAVPVTHCLHLKSAVTALDDDTVLLNPAWVDAAAFTGRRVATVDPAEPAAANVLRVQGALVCAAAHARTNERLSALGHDVHAIDVSELAKAEGAVTCCCLMVRRR